MKDNAKEFSDRTRAQGSEADAKAPSKVASIIMDGDDDKVRKACVLHLLPQF